MKSIDIEDAREWLRIHYEGGPIMNIAGAIGMDRTTFWRFRVLRGNTALTGRHAKAFMEAYPEYKA